MLIIHHRVNRSHELKGIPLEHGVEVDLRHWGDQVILQHEPFDEGERFEDYLKVYRHRLLVLNIKDTGIEEAAILALKKYRINNYFFLDLPMPATVRLEKKGIKNIAVRYSEFEPLEACLAMRNKAQWVWVDSFHRLQLDLETHARLKKFFKLCLVSPELQGRPRSGIAPLRRRIAYMAFDAVCTKFPSDWT